MINVEMAMLDPTAVFRDPLEVVANDELSHGQKLEILRRWKYDARQLIVAEEEAGMMNRRPDMFDLVVEAIHILGEERDFEQSPAN